MGRPPKPTKLHKAAGTYRKDRHGGRPPEVPGAVPDPPPAMRAEAKREWELLVGVLAPRGLLSEADRIGLAILCELWAEDRALAKKLGRMKVGTIDWKRVFGARQQLRGQLLQWCAKFALTPVDRARLKIDAAPGDQEPHDDVQPFNPTSLVG